jgi:oligopeptide transport system ATP-binding protein
MALSCNPSVLIADEPTTALDVTIQAQIVDLVRGLQKKLGMAVIWITHDLALVAGLAHRVAVMYAGHIVEEAPVGEIYRGPRHPYTRGLLRSMPRLGAARKERLDSIQGQPPELTQPFHHCPFAPRCSQMVDLCHRERPALEAVGADHVVACWRWKELPEATGPGGSPSDQAGSS